MQVRVFGDDREMEFDLGESDTRHKRQHERYKQKFLIRTLSPDRSHSADTSSHYADGRCE